MSKFLLILLGAVVGLIIGGALVFFYFGGAPRASELPGAAIQAPDPNAPAQATATISINQQFFDTVLGTIFRDMNAPAFPLNLTGQNAVESNDFKAEKVAFQQGGECAGKITLLPEGSGVKSSVRLEDSKINAPLAFTGSTAVFGQCIQFAGWAQATMNLRFDEAQQTVFGQLQIDTVNLDGVNPVVSGFVTPIVQTSLNNRVNPITILRGQQIALNLPIAATGGTLKAQVKDVRAEVKESALNLFITYDFQGLRETQPVQ